MTLRYRKIRGIVYVFIENIFCGKDDIVYHGFLLPEGYRPSEDAQPYFPVGYMDSGGNSGMCKIKADGNIGAIGPTQNWYYCGYVSYPAEN